MRIDESCGGTRTVAGHRDHLVIAFTMLFFSSPAVAVDGRESTDGAWNPHRYSLDFGVEIFRWQEFGTFNDGAILSPTGASSDQRLLTEQGPRFSLAASVNNLTRRERGLIYSGAVKIVGGEVQYDGQDDTGTHVSTDSRYGGWSADTGIGYRVMAVSGAYTVDLSAGAGTERWRRNVLSGQNALGFRTSGGAEDYVVDYWRADVGFPHRLNVSDAYLSIGVKMPFTIDEDVNIGGQPIRLHPGKQAWLDVSYELSLFPGRDGEPFGTYVKLFYGGYRFGKSPAEPAASLLVWQPESKMDVIGLSLGFSY
jgi:hypothetical protein